MTSKKNICIYVRLLTALELIGNPAAYDMTSQPHEESAPPYDLSLVIASYRQQCLMRLGLELNGLKLCIQQPVCTVQVLFWLARHSFLYSADT